MRFETKDAVIALIHYFPPYHQAGSEIMVVEMLKIFQKMGIKTNVIVTEEKQAPLSWVHDGIQVYNASKMKTHELIGNLKDARILITHHQNATLASFISKTFLIPSIYIAHNEMEYTLKAVKENKWNIVVWNTEWCMEKAKKKGIDTSNHIVFHPPVNIANMRTSTTGEFTTLINLNYDKGVRTLQEVAKRLPKYNMLGCKGGHGEQIVDNSIANIEYMEQTDNIKDDVFARTAITLMPSVYESYGMVAVESFASGIPVIANYTHGLYEAMGDAGIFINRSSYESYASQVKSLSFGSDKYQHQSGLCLERSNYIEGLTAIEIELFKDTVSKL